MNRLKDYLLQNSYLEGDGSDQSVLAEMEKQAAMAGRGFGGGSAGGVKPYHLNVMGGGSSARPIGKEYLTALSSLDQRAQGRQIPREVSKQAFGITGDAETNADAFDDSPREMSLGMDSMDEPSPGKFSLTASSVGSQSPDNSALKSLLTPQAQPTNVPAPDHSDMDKEHAEYLAKAHAALKAAGDYDSKPGWIEAILMGMVGVDAAGARRARAQALNDEAINAINRAGAHAALHPGPAGPQFIKANDVHYFLNPDGTTKIVWEKPHEKPSAETLFSGGIQYERPKGSPSAFRPSKREVDVNVPERSPLVNPFSGGFAAQDLVAGKGEANIPKDISPHFYTANSGGRAILGSVVPGPNGELNTGDRIDIGDYRDPDANKKDPAIADEQKDIRAELYRLSGQLAANEAIISKDPTAAKLQAIINSSVDAALRKKNQMLLEAHMSTIPELSGLVPANADLRARQELLTRRLGELGGYNPVGLGPAGSAPAAPGVTKVRNFNPATGLVE